MFTILLIAVPILFIIIGTVAALSFSTEEAEPEAVAPADRPHVAPALAAQPPARLFKPLPRPIGDEAASLQDLVALVEAHLRTEREAAQTFMHNPSTETLWIN